MITCSLPSTLDQILTEVSACVRLVSDEELTRALDVIQTAPRIFTAGAGRSGLCMRAFSMRLMHMGKTAYVVGETSTPSLSANDLLIIGSGSGRTAGLLTMAGLARRLGARILLYTTDAASPLAELADARVVIPAPSLHTAADASARGSIQPMGTLFEQTLLILCDSLILELMHRGGISTEQMQARHANLE
jgi:6-phospho-3-hexuloisomerase